MIYWTQKCLYFQDHILPRQKELMETRKSDAKTSHSIEAAVAPLNTVKSESICPKWIRAQDDLSSRFDIGDLAACLDIKIDHECEQLLEKWIDASLIFRLDDFYYKIPPKPDHRNPITPIHQAVLEILRSDGAERDYRFIWKEICRNRKISVSQQFVLRSLLELCKLHRSRMRQIEGSEGVFRYAK